MQLVRTVHTCLYGQTAENLLNSIVTYVNGFGSKKDSKSMKVVKFERMPDNEIVLNVYESEWGNSLNGTVFVKNCGNKDIHDDAAIRTWLAKLIKGSTKLRLGVGQEINNAAILKCKGWNRTNNGSVQYADEKSFTVAHTYAVYEVLKGRRLSKTKYSLDIVNQVLGEPFDPIRTELEQFRSEEMKRIADEDKAKNDKITEWYNAEYDKLIEMRRTKRNELKQAITDEKNRVNAEIDAAIAEATSNNVEKHSEAA